MKFAIITLALTTLGACGGHDPDPIVFNSDCENCHLTEYQVTSDPVHETVFPMRCVACHSTESWQPDDNSGHDVLFPISRGSHSGYRCEACHPAPANTFEFNCIDCHDNTHERERTDRIHRGKSGYAYESTACLRCHPNG